MTVLTPKIIVPYFNRNPKPVKRTQAKVNHYSPSLCAIINKQSFLIFDELVDTNFVDVNFTLKPVSPKPDTHAAQFWFLNPKPPDQPVLHLTPPAISENYHLLNIDYQIKLIRSL